MFFVSWKAGILARKLRWLNRGEDIQGDNIQNGAARLPAAPLFVSRAASSLLLQVAQRCLLVVSGPRPWDSSGLQYHSHDSGGLGHERSVEDQQRKSEKWAQERNCIIGRCYVEGARASSMEKRARLLNCGLAATPAPCELDELVERWVTAEQVVAELQAQGSKLRTLKEQRAQINTPGA